MNIRREQTDYAPHECTECAEPAYVPFTGPARCTNWKCSRFDQKIWEEHVMSLPDEGDPPDIEDDEPTHPGLGSLWVKAPTPPRAPRRPIFFTDDADEEDAPTQPQGKSLSFDEWLSDDDTQALSIPAPSTGAELRRIMEEYDRACAEINKSIDTVPVPCYNVGHDDE